jgi:hypothetical protein
MATLKSFDEADKIEVLYEFSGFVNATPHFCSRE